MDEYGGKGYYFKVRTPEVGRTSRKYDGFFTFPEVLEFKLNADLVALAACMTGVGRMTQGEGVLNFARAFQQAGARSVMVASWNIPVAESERFLRREIPLSATWYLALACR